MNRQRTATTILKKLAPKGYALAVLVGAAWGSAYLAAEPACKSKAQAAATHLEKSREILGK